MSLSMAITLYTVYVCLYNNKYVITYAIIMVFSCKDILFLITLYGSETMVSLIRQMLVMTESWISKTERGRIAFCAL